jgi:hypothetical protein
MTVPPTGQDIFEANRWLRLAGVAGILFLVTFIVQIFLVPQAPDYNATTRDIVSYYTQHRTGIQLGAWMTGLFAILYGVFLAGIWGTLRRTNALWLATLGLAAGIGNSLTLFAGHAINVALANDVASRYGSDTGLITALFKVASLLTMMFNTWTDGLSVLAFSAAILLSGVFLGRMRWIGWAGVISGAALLVGMLAVFDPAGPMVMASAVGALTWFIWIAGLSIRLIRAPHRPDLLPTAAQAATTS